MEITNKGKIIGRLIDDIYISQRKPEHFMRIFQGFGISQTVLDELKSKGCKDVRIVYEGVNGTIIYECSLDKFLTSIKTFVFEEEDLQKFVSISDFIIKSKGGQTKMEENKAITDWREEVSDTAKATLKIQDGETKQVVFMDEGEKRTHADFGDSIVFEVETKEFDEDKIEQVVKKNFYVNPNNYALLKQLKALGKLTGQVVKISRTGSKKSDTRYAVEKVE